MTLIAKLERDLNRLRRIPPRMREAEHADIAQATCEAMLADLRAGRPLVNDKSPELMSSGPVDIVTLVTKR